MTIKPEIPYGFEGHWTPAFRKWIWGTLIKIPICARSASSWGLLIAELQCSGTILMTALDK